MGGDTASRASVNYRANWWTQGEDPTTHNGGSGSGQPWTSTGSCGGGNTPPTVNITAPASGASFPAGSNITVSANAADPGGSVAQVEFFRGTTSLGVDTTSPYSVVFASAPAGSYSLTAVARDNLGASTTSAAVNITVASAGCTTRPGVPGGLASSSVTQNSVNLSWNAVPTVSGCAANEYRVFRDGAQVAQVGTTSTSVGGLQPDTSYSFTVAAVNAAGSSNPSAALSVRTSPASGGGCSGVPQYVAGTSYSAGQQVQNIGNLYVCVVAGWCSLNNPADQAYAPGVGRAWDDAWDFVRACGPAGTPPTVSLTAPAAGASFACNASVTVSATAADSDGTVARVEFFDGGINIATDTSAPYSVTWTAIGNGSHSLTAKATDNSNNSTTSAARSVTVTGCNTGGLPSRLLIGYWHNFDNGSGFIKLRDVSNDWDIINLAFGENAAGSTSRIVFTPHTATSEAEIRSDVQILHGRGKKVLLSVGGANGHVELRNAAERTEFVNTVAGIIQNYGLDGLDIDFEGQSVRLNAGDSDVTNPTTPVIVNLISAIREIRSRVGAGFVLTMAPETFFVQVGYQFYGG
ncbi:MAG TPA: Ig-like domain-containing protein, partial [Vicinamibacteria bacterium]